MACSYDPAIAKTPFDYLKKATECEDPMNVGVNEPGPTYKWTAMTLSTRFGWSFSFLAVAALSKYYLGDIGFYMALIFGVPGLIMFLLCAYTKIITWKGHKGGFYALFSFVYQVKLYQVPIEDCFGVDGAPADVQEKRRASLERMVKKFTERQPENVQYITNYMSDLRFSSFTRIPPMMREAFGKKLFYGTCSAVNEGEYIVCQSTGEKFLDMSNGYGANLAGHDRSKQFMAKAMEVVKDVSPAAMGPVIPETKDVVERLLRLSGIGADGAVSFHMSGTEACMAAASFCRFNTQRKLIVIFCDSYHGWWDGTLMVGNNRPPVDVLICPVRPFDVSIIRGRASEIACVYFTAFYDDLVMELHMGADPLCMSKDGPELEDMTMKKIEGYTDIVKGIRKVCTEAKVPFIVDDVLNGFRLAPGGTQEFFGVKGDMVIYGKGIGNGAPVGVVVGKKWLMEKYDPMKPLRVCFVGGTYAAAPVTVAMLNESLKWMETGDYKNVFADNVKQTKEFAITLNKQYVENQIPVVVRTVAGYINIVYTQASRYNWVFTYYLTEEGMEYSFFGFRQQTNLGYTAKEFEVLRTKMFNAALRCRDDGWWWTDGKTDQGDLMAKEMLRGQLGLKKSAAKGTKEPLLPK